MANGVYARHLEGVEHVALAHGAGEQPVPVFKAHIFPGGLEQVPVGKADLHQLAQGIIGKHRQQQHGRQGAGHIRPGMPLLEHDLMVADLYAVGIALFHGVLQKVN